MHIADLAPGDEKSASLDLSRFEVVRIASPEDPLFELAYDALDREFGAIDELETRDVLRRRLGRPAEDPMTYEMLLVRCEGAVAAVRDHTVLLSDGEAFVHLSHALVMPVWRRTGLAGWLRAWPVESARRCLGESSGEITLVAEMEHLSPLHPERFPRLRAYEKAGFFKVDPSVVPYVQPDFRPPEIIDQSGERRPLPFSLVVRRIGARDRNHDPDCGAAPDYRASVCDVWSGVSHHGNGRGATGHPCAWGSAGDNRLDSTDAMITAFHHPGFAAPIGPHIMPMQKFARVAEALRDMRGVQIEEPAPISEGDLLRIHSPDYVAAIKTGQPRELAESQKFPWSPALFPSVCLTNGGVLAAARRALRDGVSAALASGFHHACADHGEGFCTFNGLVVAAEAMRAAGEIQSAAFLDLDLHYGNGTAALVAARPHLYALSVYGNDYANNTPFRDVHVRHHADGSNHYSVALPAGCDGPSLLARLGESLPRLGKPDVLIYQAGADPYFEDPYSPLALTHEDLYERDCMVFRFAHEHRIPIAWVLAGGYTSDLDKVVRVHVNTFKACLDVFSASSAANGH